MKVTTKDFNQAGFYLALGAELKSINKKYPHNTFTFLVPEYVLWYEKVGGWVPYKRFCAARQELKIRGRELAGLPGHFTGRQDFGFLLKDLATIKKS